MPNVLCCISACLEETKGDDVPQSLKDKADAVKNAGGVATLAKLVQELPELLTRNTEILDEADRMLDMGFMPQVKNCVYHHTMPKFRQTLMFSATFKPEIQNLAKQFLNNYLFLGVGVVGGACEDVRQNFYDVTEKSKMQRNEMLVDMLKELKTHNNNEKVLVFVERKKDADILALFLCQDELPATTIHGDRAQEEREMALNDFKTGSKPILVATAVAARGLDIKGVTHVVNFQMPKEVEEYVHR